jgi:hypothetical protein
LSLACPIGAIGKRLVATPLVSPQAKSRTMAHVEAAECPVIEKEALKFRDLEHVLIGKVEQLFRGML